MKTPSARARHQQRLGDLGRGHPQPAERNDHGDAIRRGAVLDPTRSGRPIGQTRFALDPVAANLLTCTTHADPGGLGRRPQRPSLIHDPTSKHTRPLQLSAALR
jgi:hypothetical protein